MKRNQLFICLILIFSIQLYSQDFGQGFTSLQEFDYFKAKKIFYKDMKKNPVPCAYGLGVIFLRKDNPFHNYDSAYKYCMISKFEYLKCDDKKKAKYKKIGVTDSIIKSLCDTVFNYSFLRAVEFTENQKRKTDSILNKYISWYYFSTRREDAIKMRDQIAFQEAKKIHSSDNYREFIKNWPESCNMNDAEYFLEKSIYEENTPLNTITEFKNFALNFSSNRFAVSAQNEIFRIHKNNRNKNGLIDFIRTFPKNENNSEAWKLFFTLSVKNYNTEDLAEFVLDYPDFPFKKTIIDEIELLKIPFFKIKTNEKLGFVDTSGKITIPAVYEDLGDFSEGLCVASENDKYGFIDKNGKWIIKPIFDECEDFLDGVSIVKQNNKSFLIDRSVSKVSNEYDEINTFNEGLAVVKLNDKYGAINKLGNVVIPISYEKLGDFHNEHAWFQLNGKYGIIDHKNFVNIINEFDWIDNYGEIMRAKKNNGYGVINKNSMVIIPFEYERIDIGPGNIFVLVKNGKYGFGDLNGCLHSKIDNDFDNKLIPSELIRIPDPKKQQILFKVIKDDEQGIMNQNGKILGEIGEYEEIYLPSCGLIRVMGNDKYFYLDMKMKPAFNSKFDEAEDYINNFAAVKTKGKWQIIDLSGKVVFNENCESIERPEDPLFTNDYFLVKTNSGIGLLNQQMAWALTPKYQEIEFQSDGTLHALAEGKQVYIDLKKNKIIWKEE